MTVATNIRVVTRERGERKHRVHDAAGNHIGFVERQTRLAAGPRGNFGRKRLPFWAAFPLGSYGWSEYGAALGTRFVTRAQATAAVLDYVRFCEARRLDNTTGALLEWQTERRDAPGAPHRMNRYPA